VGVLVVEHDAELDEEDQVWIDALAEQAVAAIDLEDTITARSLELKKTQARLLESKKMAALVHLVAGITHEMNSPLGALVSASDTIERAVGKLRGAEGPPSPGVLGALSESSRALSDASKRIDAIVRRLKSFVRLDEAVQQEIGVETCIEDALALLSHRLEKIALVRDYSQTTAIVCYPARLNEVFATILRNACDAVEGKQDATIVVRTRAHRATISVEIDDNGVGMSEEEIQRVFDPGFTTRDARVRMGLGLAIAHQVVDDHSGEIAFESQIGLGTKVSIELPIAPSARPRV
jgi:signal transduction histidine kinase